MYYIFTGEIGKCYTINRGKRVLDGEGPFSALLAWSVRKSLESQGVDLKICNDWTLGVLPTGASSRGPRRVDESQVSVVPDGPLVLSLPLRYSGTGVRGRESSVSAGPALTVQTFDVRPRM